MAASASREKIVKLVRIVLMTAGNQEQANRIARVLVDERLAACVNVVGPIRSVYRWREAVEDETEYLLVAKTRAALSELCGSIKTESAPTPPGRAETMR